MATARDDAVQLLNDSKLATDAEEKVGLLQGLMEIVVRRSPDLLPEFLSDLTELRVDPAPAVRKFLAGFVESAVGVQPDAPTVVQCLRCLDGLLADALPAVVKRALLACNVVHRVALSLVAVQGAAPVQPPGLREVWGDLHGVKERILGMMVSRSNDAVRLSAAKFAEQVVLLNTADVVPALPGSVDDAAVPRPFPAANQVVTRTALVQEAEGVLVKLLGLLRLKMGEDVSGPVAIVVIKAAGSIAQQRPVLMGKVLPPMLALANSGAFNVDGKGTASGVQVSIGTALKGTLACLLKCGHPNVAAWRRKLVDALHAMGAGDVAGVAVRALDKQAAAKGRPAGLDGPEHAAKRIKLEPGAEAAAGPPGVSGPGQHQAPPAIGAVVMAPPQPAAHVPHAHTPSAQPSDVTSPTSAEDLFQVQTICAGLASQQDAATLASFVCGLSPSVLADVVMANMGAYPPRHALTPDHIRPHPWTAHLQHLLVASQFAQPQPAPGPGVPPGTQSPPDCAVTPPGLQPLHPVQESDPPAGPPPQVKQEGPSRALTSQLQPRAAAPRPDTRVAAPARVYLPPFRLEPASLTLAQQKGLRRTLMSQLLQAGAAGVGGLRAHLVTRLGALGPDPMEAGQQLLDWLLEDFQARGGEQLALRWLYALWDAHGAGRQAASAGTTAAPALAGADRRIEPAKGSTSVVAALGAPTAMEIDNPRTKGALPDRGSQAAVGTSGRGPSSDGSPYDAALLALLKGLQRVMPEKDKTITRVLLEAPALPMPAVCDFLRELCSSGPEAATLALVSAQSLVLERPPARSAVLAFVLDTSVAADASPKTRDKAVRLLVNRLASEEGLTDTIVAFASAQLDTLLRQATGTAADTEASTAAQQKMTGAMATDHGGGLGLGAAVPSGQALAATASGAVALPFTSAAADAAVRACALYCGLSAKRHALLRHLFEVYARATPEGRAAINGHGPRIATAAGVSAPALLDILTTLPKGGEDLALLMVSELTGAAKPPSTLIAACTAAWQSSGDARFLPPILPGLSKAAALEMLPRVVTLAGPALRSALLRLVQPVPPDQRGLFSPTEVFVALHSFDHKKEGVPLKAVTDAISVCLTSARTVFVDEALAAALQQMVARNPLPYLFMRTVLQTQAAAPKLASFIVGVLQTLVGRQVWADATQWRGWVLVARKAAPGSYPALLTLPTGVLEGFLADKDTPRLMRPQLLAYATSKACNVAVPRSTLTMLAAAPAAAPAPGAGPLAAGTAAPATAAPPATG